MSFREGSDKLLLAIRRARGELWPCGHPRTAENTQSIGKAGERCRQCRRQIARVSAQRNVRRKRLRDLPSKIEIAEHRVRMLKNELKRLSAEAAAVTRRQALNDPAQSDAAWEREIATARIERIVG